MIFVSERKENPIKQSFAKLRRHRGLADLFSYLIQLDDATILHKDGALSRHFRYTGPDIASATDAELDAYSETWANSLNFLER